MKKMFISMLAMAAMVSCSSENDVIDEVNPVDGKVEIKMNAGVGNIITKAAVGQETNGDLSSDLSVFFMRYDGATVDWTTLGTAISATLTTTGSITFAEQNKQYYTKDGVASHFFGYYPTGTVSGGAITWDIDGKNDILVSDIQLGSKASTTPLEFAFAHKLTLLTVKVKAANAIIGEKIKSITFKDENNSASYTPGASSGLEFACSGTANITTEGAATSEDISTTGIAGGTILLSPAATGSNRALKVEVVTTNNTKETTYSGTVTVGCQAGTSYVVTLTIAQEEVTGSATVGQWTTGSGVDGDIK